MNLRRCFKNYCKGSDSQFVLNREWIRTSEGQNHAPYPVTLETYIRNSIHHPENRSNSYRYSTIDLQMSIEEMLAILFSKEQ